MEAPPDNISYVFYYRGHTGDCAQVEEGGPFVGTVHIGDDVLFFTGDTMPEAQTAFMEEVQAYLRQRLWD
jgi:hypothetical protein